ncbi:MAG: sulfatase/phosphatase domain-containing protein, partial [Pseudomonadota bacterium]|nr:sulfatase/phosphatase domain-containing protein [Pseudomonadota bacterium]
TTYVGPQDDGYSPTLPNGINDNRVKAVTYVDVNASYRIIDNGRRMVEVFGAIKNAFNTNLPVAPANNIGTNANLYDVLGHTFRVGVVRVPMVMYEPGTVPAGAVNTGRIRNLDYAPTFLDLAGVEQPAQFEGVSAWPIITGKVADKDWKAPDFTYEYYWEWAYPMTPGTFAIQRDNLKYIQYYGVYDTDELYDLARDPDEMHNLIDDPAYLQAKVDLRKALYQQLANRDGRHAIPYGERNAIGSVRRNRAGTGAAPFPDSWLVEPNRVDRKDNVLPDSVAKQRAHDEGKAFVRFPVLGSPEANENAGIKD